MLCSLLDRYIQDEGSFIQRVSEVIKAGQQCQALPPIDKDDTYKPSQIKKAHPKAQIQDSPANFAADVFGMGVVVYNGENEKPSVDNVSLTCSSQWLALVDYSLSGGVICNTPLVFPGGKTEDGSCAKDLPGVFDGFFAGGWEAVWKGVVLHGFLGWELDPRQTSNTWIL